MKKLIPLIVCMLLGVVMFAQDGVNFQHLTLDEALAKAKAENKLVFMDCYTTWCGPCKHMTNEVFPQAEAGEFFNPRFVCVKYDMEKEGKELAEKFGVKAYPSFYILRPDGTVQHCLVGGDDLDVFIERVNLGLKEKTSLHYLTQQYEKGKMNKKQLMAYKVALDDAYDEDKAKEVEERLKGMLTAKDKLKAEFWPLFKATEVGSPDFAFILEHLPALKKNIGKDKLDRFLGQSYSRALYPYANGKGEAADLEEIKRQIAGLDFPKKELLLKVCELADASIAGNVGGLITAVENNLSAFSGENCWTAVSALREIQDKATKAELNRMAALTGKIAQDPKNNQLKPYIERTADQFKKLGHAGVYFEDLTFEQALEKAKQERKMIFVDCYTSWCGPCKYMTSTIFPKEEVGDFMNRNFVCVKYDMEKGEGPALKERFGVRAFPTFLLVKADGTIQHCMVGGSEAEEFIARVKEGMDDSKAFGPLNNEYEKGNRDKEFMARYVKSLVAVYSDKADKVAGELYGLLDDQEKVSQDYWFLFENPDLLPDGSEGAAYLSANREKFNRTVGREKVDKRLSLSYQLRLMRILFGRDSTATPKDLDRMKKEVTALKLVNENSLVGMIGIVKAKIAGNPAQLLAACEKEAVRIPAEEFPYVYLVSAAKEKATPSQMSRWVKLGRQVAAQSKDEGYRQRMEEFVKTLEEK